MGYPCPAGYNCPAGTLVELSCEVGTYQANEGQANCTLCPAGMMCEQQNMTHPDPCRSGNYCPLIFVEEVKSTQSSLYLL